MGSSIAPGSYSYVGPNSEDNATTYSSVYDSLTILRHVSKVNMIPKSKVSFF